MTEKLTHISLFSGIGTIDLATTRAGFETLAFCEKDDFCQKVLRKHYGEGSVIIDDICGFTIDALAGRGLDRERIRPGAVDLITGGFPCQPFSIAGKQRAHSDDRYLWPEMLRIIKEFKPRWICAENVAGIINLALDDVCASLEAEGYEVGTVVLPASSVGAWHVRQRVFIIAHANSVVSRPQWAQDRNEQTAHSKAVGGQSAELEITAHAESERCEERESTAFGYELGQCTGRCIEGDVTDATHDGLQSAGRTRDGWGRFTNGNQQANGTDATHAYRERQSQSGGLIGKERRRSGDGGEKYNDATGTGRQAIAGVRGMANGIATGLYGIAGTGTESRQGQGTKSFWEKTEPPAPIDHDSKPYRTNRLAALGNAVVWQQIYPIVEAIAKYELSKFEVMRWR